MGVIDSKTDTELLRSLLAETAKASSELRCAQSDIVKAQNRLGFAVAVINAMINRKTD
jgi:predicted Mrr-cat superfamily restriction endonuclease